MIDFGTVIPGETLPIPFFTFASDGASVTMTGLATTDIEIYKDGGATTRASDSGYALLDTDGIDFDSKTGIHGFSVDLSDNSDANFYEAGSRYWVVVASVTVDSETVNFVAATFRIGYPGAILDTTIATLASQVSFTLEDASADASAYVGCTAYVHDLASAVQVAIGVVSAYAVTTKTVTLAADPAIFTMAAGDNISLFPPSNVATVAGTAQTAGDLADLVTTVDTVVDGIQTDLSNGTDGLGAIKAETAAILADTDLIDDGTSGLAKIATDVAAVLVDTAVIGAAGAGLTDLGGMSTTMKGQVNTEVDGSMVTYGLDHLVQTSVTGTDIADDSIVAKMVSKETTADWDDFVNTTESLQALRDHIADGTNLTEAGGDGDHLTEAGATGNHLTAIPWNASWDAEVQSEVDDALKALGLDHLISASVTGTDVADNSIIAKMVDDAATADWDGYDPTTASLEALNVDTDAVIADLANGTDGLGAIKGDTAAILTDTAVIGALGAGLTNIPWNASWDAEVQSEVADALAVFWTTPATLVDLIWDEPLTGAAHNDATSSGRRLRQTSEVISVDSAVDDPGAAATTTVFNTDLTDADNFWNDSLLIFTSGSLSGQSRPILTYANTNGAITLDEALTAAPGNNDTFIIQSFHIHPKSQIADAIWDEAVSGHTSAGTFGKTDADILADTNELQADWANGGRLDLLLDSAVALFTTDMTEAYAANGAAMNPTECLHAIHQMLQQFGISGTSLTVRKLDNTTTAFVVTLDDATNPTDAKRV